MKNYTKKPITIQAIKYDGNNIQEIIDFVGNENLTFSDVGIMQWSIKTLEGDMLISLGDYVIKGIKGEFYPCKPDIFEMSYDEVNTDHKKIEITQYDTTLGFKTTKMMHYEIIGMLRYCLTAFEKRAISVSENIFGH